MNNAASSPKGGGGALLSDGSGMTTISRTHFDGNNATDGCGGAVRMHNIKLLMFNSTFNRNSISGHGGLQSLDWNGGLEWWNGKLSKNGVKGVNYST